MFAHLYLKSADGMSVNLYPKTVHEISPQLYLMSVFEMLADPNTPVDIFMECRHNFT